MTFRAWQNLFKHTVTRMAEKWYASADDHFGPDLPI